jgi:hypothetical protein
MRGRRRTSVWTKPAGAVREWTAKNLAEKIGPEVKLREADVACNTVVAALGMQRHGINAMSLGQRLRALVDGKRGAYVLRRRTLVGEAIYTVLHAGQPGEVSEAGVD